LVSGLKKKRINSLIRVFDVISPENRFSTALPVMSNISAHNRAKMMVGQYSGCVDL